MLNMVITVSDGGNRAGLQTWNIPLILFPAAEGVG